MLSESANRSTSELEEAIGKNLWEAHVASILDYMFFISRLKQPFYDAEFTPRPVEFFKTAVKYYETIGQDHWIRKLYPKADEVLKSFDEIKEILAPIYTK